jgi:hypothetical protein
VGSDWRLTGWPEDEDRPPILEAVVLVGCVGRWGSEERTQCTEDIEEGGHDSSERSRAEDRLSVIAPALGRAMREHIGKKKLIFLLSTPSW